ncbi:MAG: chemotaxis protein CheD [Bacillota bacterium]|nr:chemotaxis protein CheD [Bacillota bacterium]
MESKIIIGIGDYAVAKSPNILYTSSLGSCLALVLYDPIQKIAGMSHILLPYHEKYINKSNPSKFADTAVGHLITEMKSYGARPNNLAAKLAGGSKLGGLMPKDDVFRVGEKNVISAVAQLKKYGIPIESKDVGGDYYRTVEFIILENKLKIRRNGNEIIYI